MSLRSPLCGVRQWATGEHATGGFRDLRVQKGLNLLCDRRETRCDDRRVEGSSVLIGTAEPAVRQEG